MFLSCSIAPGSQPTRDRRRCEQRRWYNAKPMFFQQGFDGCRPGRAGSEPEVEFPDELVVVELVGGAAFEGDLAMDDDIAAVGDPDRLGEVLLGHEHAQAIAVLELLDLLDGAPDQERRQP